MTKEQHRYKLSSRPKNYGKTERGDVSAMIGWFDDLDIAKKRRDENEKNNPNKEYLIFDMLEKEFIYGKYDEAGHHQAIVNRFEVLAGELHDHCEKIIEMYESLNILDPPIEMFMAFSKATIIKQVLEVNFPEYFKEKK